MPNCLWLLIIDLKSRILETLPLSMCANNRLYASLIQNNFSFFSKKKKKKGHTYIHTDIATTRPTQYSVLYCTVLHCNALYWTATLLCTTAGCLVTAHCSLLTALLGNKFLCKPVYLLQVNYTVDISSPQIVDNYILQVYYTVYISSP